MAAKASAIFSTPSLSGPCTIPLIKGLSSAFIVSFIFEVASVTGSTCIHRSNGMGDCSVANFMHFG